MRRLPGNALTGNEMRKRIAELESRNKKKGDDQKEEISFLLMLHVVVGLLICLGIAFYYKKHRTSDENSEDRTLRKMIEYIHDSVNDECNDSRSVPMEELFEHFGRSPQYHNSIENLQLTVFRDIVFAGATFKSLKPNWPARCYVRFRWQMNFPRLVISISRDKLILIVVVSASVIVAAIIAKVILGRESIHKESPRSTEAVADASHS